MGRRQIAHWLPPKRTPEPDATAVSDLAYWKRTERDDPFDEREFDAISQVDDDGRALARWKDCLGQYVDLQGTLDALRLRPPSERPWPASDNPMVGYLNERSTEIVTEGGLEAAISWLAANAWFEGALAERSRVSRFLDSSD